MQSDSQKLAAPKHGTNILTLIPLATDGPDALDTHDVPGLAQATLSEIELDWQNESLGITIQKAQNIFATTAKPFPPAAALTQAGFELLLDASPRPHKLSIRPPNTLLLEFPADLPIVFQWLDRRHFRTLAALMVALATAFAPALNDGDSDEDDCTTDRCTLAHSA